MSRRTAAAQPNPLHLVPPPQSVPYQGHQSGWIQMPPSPSASPIVQPAADHTVTAIVALVALVIGVGGAWAVADFAYAGDRLRQLEAQNQQLQSATQQISDRLNTAQGAICR
jgi:ABC-type sulfate transport system permease subunit